MPQIRLGATRTGGPCWPFAVKEGLPETARNSRTPPVPIRSRSFGKETRDALVGQPGRSARRRGNPKPNPLFRSPAEPEPSGKGTAKGRPESLLDGRPEEIRRVRPERNRRSGSRVRPVEEGPQDGQSPGCRKDARQDGRRLAGKTSDRWKRGLPRESLKGRFGACFGCPGSDPVGACSRRIRLGTDRGRKTPAGT